MKKWLFPLLLLALCLSLAACDLSFLSGAQQESGDYTEVYAHMENRAYVDAMDALGRIRQGRQTAENMVSDDVAMQYDGLREMIDRQDFSSAAKYIAEQAFNHYLRLPEGDTPAWSSIEAGWMETIYNYGYKPESFVFFYEYGRFGWTRDAQELLWIVKEYTATQLDIEVYYPDTLESAGFIRLNTSDETLRYMVQERDGGSSYELNCVRSWFRTGAYNDEWMTPGADEFFPETLILGDGSVTMGENTYPIREEHGEAYLYDDNGTLLYTIRLRMDEKYTCLEVQNDWDRREYYRMNDYTQMRKIYEYERALEILNILKDSDGGLDYDGDSRSRQEWFAYIYEAMANADGYGESARILSNFTRVDGLLVDITTEPDNLNGHVQPYEYDSKGRLIYAWDESLTLFIYGTPVLPVLVDGYDDFYEEAPHQYYFAYDARGRISRITHKNWDTEISVITPTYDAYGNIDRLDIRMADGQTRVANFTYDSDLMPRSMGNDLFLAENNVLRSISYGEYFLEFAWTIHPHGHTLNGITGWISRHGQDTAYTEEYAYENGRLIRRTVTVAWCEGLYSTTDVYLYTYDETGRILSHHCTTTSGDNSWENTLYYVYQDVLFYNDQPQVNDEQLNKILAYEKAMDVLTLLETCGGTLTFEGETKTQQEWLAYVRQAMTDAEGYGESARILANFSQLENVLVGVSTDPNGSNMIREYAYDAAGRLVFANDNYYTKYLYCTLELPVTPHYYFEYDAQNRVSRIIHKNGDALYATFTLTYNDRGQVKRMDIVMADGEERYATFTYTGDMMPRYVDEEIWEDEWTEGDYEDDFGEIDENAFNVLNCISHGEMFMDFAWTPDFDGYTYSGMSFWYPVSEEEWMGYSEYVEYDDQDRRIRKTIWIDDVVDVVITYAYDADGKLISETHTAADGQTTTYYYIYGAILVYDFTA